jgi:hypothetical protein
VSEPCLTCAPRYSCLELFLQPVQLRIPDTQTLLQFLKPLRFGGRVVHVGGLRLRQASLRLREPLSKICDNAANKNRSAITTANFENKVTRIQ